MLTKDFKEFVKLLIDYKVEYLIVGGYAVGFHGYPRFTGDLDIWINPTKANAHNLLKVVDKFGFSEFNLTVADFIKEGNVIQFGYQPVRIDVLNKLDGVEFNECYNRKSSVKIDDIEIDFIGLNDLLKNKRASGRYRDLDDAQNLESD